MFIYAEQIIYVAESRVKLDDKLVIELYHELERLSFERQAEWVLGIN